jgi:hypothetical protein
MGFLFRPKTIPRNRGVGALFSFLCRFRQIPAIKVSRSRVNVGEKNRDCPAVILSGSYDG